MPREAGSDVTSPTPLQRHLAGERNDHPNPLDAFTLARKAFQAGQRVDMNGLAGQLGINRVTLYRWVGSRDQLLTEVLWSLTQRTIERAMQGTTASADGATSKLATVLTYYNGAVMTHTGMSRFLAEEGDFALRLLTVQSGFQLRLVTFIADLIDTEAAAGRLATAFPSEDLAFVLVRVIESYVYRKVITGEESDPGQAGRILAALLPARPV
jgi:AcrR family transcriptional regulator